MADPSQPHGGHNPHQPVPLFRKRTDVYKIGLIGLVICCILFLVGFSTTHWISLHEFRRIGGDDWSGDDPHELSEEPFMHWGLWDAPCMYRGSSCSAGLHIAQVVFCLHLAGYIACLVVAGYENCRKLDPLTYHSRRLELFILATGILGTAGMVAFGIWYSNSIIHKGYQWSLVLTSISLTGLYVTFFLLLCGNRRPLGPAIGTVITRQANPGVVYYNPGNPYGTTVVHSYSPGQPAYQQQQYVAQTQPLLPHQQGYPYPAASQPHGAPPAYSLPPAYPASPSSVVTSTSGYQPAYKPEAYAKANAPPCEEGGT